MKGFKQSALISLGPTKPLLSWHSRLPTLAVPEHAALSLALPKLPLPHGHTLDALHALGCGFVPAHQAHREGTPEHTRLMFCWEKAGATPLRTRRQCADLLLCVSMLGILARLLICGDEQGEACLTRVRRSPRHPACTHAPR